MRWLYWQFDKPASLHSNKTVFLNKRLQLAREKIGTISKNMHYDTIEIGTDPLKKIHKKSIRTLSFVFFGVIKRSQGLDLFFDAFDVNKLLKTIVLHVIGGGPDLEYFKKRAKTSHIKVKFYGYVADDDKVNMIIDRSLIGLATYPPDESNVTRYTDPSKIKKYLSRGLPVITTNMFEFSKEILRYKAGVIIPYDKRHVIPSIQFLLKNYHRYSQNALTLAHKYLYTRLYKRLFL
jgi:glycosyltransferase involved in cell wall biosynthesis